MIRRVTLRDSTKHDHALLLGFETTNRVTCFERVKLYCDWNGISFGEILWIEGIFIK